MTTKSSLPLPLSVTDINIKNIATQACYKAGELILGGSKTISLQNDVISKIGSRDIVTQVDIEVQEVIKSTIQTYFPSHSFLGEEDVPPGKEAATAAITKYLENPPDYFWICDPIDGTTNFAHGMPLSGIILAFVSHGELIYGHIYDPFRNETFSAWKGQGAYLNGQKISCCSTPNLKQSVLCTGSPPNIDSLNACLRATNLISSQVRTVRMLGSAAVMLSWVACGRVTGYFEADLNVWDLAAGCLIIQEAGGMVTDVHGKPYSLATRNLVSTNGIIHNELLTQLQIAQMWID